VKARSRGRTTLLTMVRRDLGAKLFAVGAAFVLWFFVNAGKRETLVLSFPIELHNLPEQVVVANPDRLDAVSVKLNGPGPLLASLEPRRAPIVLDLAHVRVGEETRLKLRDEMIRLPRGVRVLDIEPSYAPVRLEPVRHAVVAVTLARGGEPAEGYHVGSVRIAPKKVSVSGPKSIVERLQSVETEPFDLTGLQAPSQRTMTLVRPDGLISLSPERVTVEVAIVEEVVTRELRQLPVSVRNIDRPFQLRPAHVNLTVRGPSGRVRVVELEEGSVYVDAGSLGPGDHVVEAEVTLPAGVEVVKWDPPSLRLEIPAEKNGARR